MCRKSSCRRCRNWKPPMRDAGRTRSFKQSSAAICKSTQAVRRDCTLPRSLPSITARRASSSSARIFCIRAHTRSTMRSGRRCSQSAWARSASSPRRVQGSTASPRRRSRRSSAWSAMFSWGRRTSSASASTSSAWSFWARRSFPSRAARARSRTRRARRSAIGRRISRTPTTSSARRSGRTRTRAWCVTSRR